MTPESLKKAKQDKSYKIIHKNNDFELLCYNRTVKHFLSEIN